MEYLYLFIYLLSFGSGIACFWSLYLAKRINKQTNLFKRFIFFIGFICFFPAIIVDMILTVKFYNNTVLFSSGFILPKIIFTPVVYLVFNAFCLVYIFKYILSDKAPEQDLKSFCSQHNLSFREKEIFELLIEDCKYTEIGNSLYISLPTVKTHVQSIFIKTKVKRKTDLKNKFLQRDLIQG